MRNEIEDELGGKVAEDLFTFVDRNHYPVNPSSGMYAIISGLRDAGFSMGLSPADKKLSVLFDITTEGGIKYLFQTDRDYSQIARGFGNQLKYSIGSFRQSAQEVVTSFEMELFNSFNVRLIGNKNQKIVGGIICKVFDVIKTMDEIWKEDYFARFHENVLMSRVGNVPPLVPSKILPEVLKQFDLREYELLVKRDHIYSQDHLCKNRRRKFESDVSKEFFRRMALEKGFSFAYDDLRNAPTAASCLVEASRMKWEGFPEY